MDSLCFDIGSVTKTQLWLFLPVTCPPCAKWHMRPSPSVLHFPVSVSISYYISCFSSTGSLSFYFNGSSPGDLWSSVPFLSPSRANIMAMIRQSLLLLFLSESMTDVYPSSSVHLITKVFDLGSLQHILITYR